MATRWRAMNGLVVALGLGGMAASITPRDCPARRRRTSEPPGGRPSARPGGGRDPEGRLADGRGHHLDCEPRIREVITVPGASTPGGEPESGGTDRLIGPGGECRADAPDGRDVGPNDLGLRQGGEGAGTGRPAPRAEGHGVRPRMARGPGRIPPSSADADKSVVPAGHHLDASPQASPQAPPP